MSYTCLDARLKDANATEFLGQHADVHVGSTPTWPLITRTLKGRDEVPWWMWRKINSAGPGLCAWMMSFKVVLLSYGRWYLLIDGALAGDGRYKPD